MFKKMKNHKGFTLIEMLAVIAIVAILVAVIIPVVNGSTDKAAAATNASNLRGVEGEIITMMLLDPTIFGDQKGDFERIEGEIGEIQDETDRITIARDAMTSAATDLSNLVNRLTRTLGLSYTINLEKSSETLIQEQTDLQNSYNSHKSSHWGGQHSVFCSTCNKSAGKLEIYDLHVAYALQKEEYNAAIEENDTEIAGKREEQGELYLFRAENGMLTIGDTTLEAPASKAVSTDTVSIDKDVEMIVFVDTSKYEAYAYYPSGNTKYNAHNFSVAAGNNDAVTG